MSNELARAKARYMAAKDQARRQAALNLRGLIQVDFYLSGWSRKALEAHAAEWRPCVFPYPNGGWDWEEIFRRHQNDIDALDVVIWGPGTRLSGIALITTAGASVTVQGVEGDPRADCPLIGRRALIVLEAAACYAQGLGKKEIRLYPANDDLASFYQDDCGFTLEKPRKGAAYYRKEI